ncbi:MAG: hypothetical protein ABIH00_06250 [Armatimonadota bacterium]
MKKLLIVLVAIAFLAGAAFAASTDTQTVYFEIDAINEISFGVDATLTIDNAGAGSEPNRDNSDQYWSITTNETAKKLTVQINAAMPSSTFLEVSTSIPTGGQPMGSKTLTTTAQSLITSLETVAQSNISYAITLDADVAAGLPADGSRIITWTLTDE